MPLTREEKILTEMGFKQITQNEFDHPLYGYLWLHENFRAKDIASAIFESGMKRKTEEIKMVLNLKTP